MACYQLALVYLTTLSPINDSFQNAAIISFMMTQQKHGMLLQGLKRHCPFCTCTYCSICKVRVRLCGLLQDLGRLQFTSQILETYLIYV